MNKFVTLWKLADGWADGFTVPMSYTYLTQAPRFTVHILVNQVQRPIALMKAFSPFTMVAVPVPQYLEMSRMIK